jgi:ankyrin repeat protein
MISSARGLTTIVSLLLQHGAEVDLKSQDVCHLLLLYSLIHSLPLLISPPSQDSTALLLSVLSNQPEALLLLLEARADPNATDKVHPYSPSSLVSCAQ